MWGWGVSACVSVMVLIFSAQEAGAELTNVALNKPATQSSKHSIAYGHPDRIVDGNTNTNIRQCTSTAGRDKFSNRWWRVDLQGMYEVEAVKITNRGDCCGYRLADFDVYVMEKLKDPSEVNHDPNDLCVHRTGAVAQGATERLDCDSKLTGRYVSLVLPYNKWPLNFCEMEVLATPSSALSNVAVNKPVMMSSLAAHSRPEYLVDGDHTKCARTYRHGTEIEQYFRVDLQGMYEVEAVKLTNRGDCCADELTHFNIYVTETSLEPYRLVSYPNDKCAWHTQWIALGATVRLGCNKKLTGRYVTLEKYNNHWELGICEMEVLGRPVKALPQVTNVALNKPAEQSSKHATLGRPERIVDSNKNTIILQCTSTADRDNLPNRWWRVDLQGMYLVEAVRITNRGDCCGYRVADFDVYVMETLEDPSEVKHDHNDLCVHRTGAIAQGGTERLDCNIKLIGRYVSLVLPHNKWPLNFCEMEVLGTPWSE